MRAEHDGGVTAADSAEDAPGRDHITHGPEVGHAGSGAPPVDPRTTGFDRLFLVTWCAAWLWTVATLRAALEYESTRSSTLFFGLHAGLTVVAYVGGPAVVLSRMARARTEPSAHAPSRVRAWLRRSGRDLALGLALEARLLLGIAPCFVMAWLTGGLDVRVMLFALITLTLQAVAAMSCTVLWGRLALRHPLVVLAVALVCLLFVAGEVNAFHLEDMWWELIHLEIPAYLADMADRTVWVRGSAPPLNLALLLSVLLAAGAPLFLAALSGLWWAVAGIFLPGRPPTPTSSP